MTSAELEEKKRKTLLELQSKLKATPIISKLELLTYIIENKPTIEIEIITQARLSYQGNIVFVGETKDKEDILIFKITGDFRNDKDHILHISVGKIESIEFLDALDAIDVLSKGTKTKRETYEISGKLEVRRKFKDLAEHIKNTYGITIGIPEMTLPTDGNSLNRVLKLTQTIQEAISDVLNEQDALDSWKDRYRKLEFIENDTLKVKGSADTIQIFFEFSNIYTREIDTELLKKQLIEVL